MAVAAGLLAGTVATSAIGWASPAGATINKPNTIGCAGHADIPEKNGKTVTIDATQSKAHVPRSAAGPVTYSGSVTTVTHDHHGYVAVVLGPFNIKFYTWGVSQNSSNKLSDSGTRKYPSEMKNVPPGEYRVKGGHFSPQGSCTGEMTLIVDGSPLSNPAGIVALVGTIVFALLFLLSLFGKPVLGLFGGLLLGLFLVVDLMLWKVTYPTTVLLFALPIVGLVLGVALGLWGPIGGSAP